MTPAVTICVPTFNRSADLIQTLRALQRQTFTDWEAIVGDDASTDDTPEAVAALGDSRIRLLRHQRNLGIYGNWNALIAEATGRYVAIYHDHDLYLPTIVERSVALLEAHSSVQFAHTALFLINDAGEKVGVDIRPFPAVMPGRDLRRMLATGWHSPVMAATAMVRREAYAKVGPYEFDKYGLGCDKDMWFRLAALGDVGYVSEPQVHIRARTKTGPTSAFSWRTVDATIRMRKDQLTAESPESSAEWKRFSGERDRMLLMLMARAVLLEPESGIAEGLALVEQVAGAACRAACRAMVRCPRLTRAAGRPLLRLHYARVERRQARDRAEARRG